MAGKIRRRKKENWLIEISKSLFLELPLWAAIPVEVGLWALLFLVIIFFFSVTQLPMELVLISGSIPALLILSGAVDGLKEKEPVTAVNLQPKKGPAELLFVNNTVSVETLKKIEWYRFEQVCAAFGEAMGFRVRQTTHGADGGIDLEFFDLTSGDCVAIGQCKARPHFTIGVKELRELYGVMSAQNIAHGLFFTSGNFSNAAHAGFATNSQRGQSFK